MPDNLVTRLRDFPVRDCCSQRSEAADRIERLEAALHEIGAMNALRDRWSDPIENVIRAALEGKDAPT